MTPTTKPRWRLLTDATRRGLKPGDWVCAVGEMTGNELEGPILEFLYEPNRMMRWVTIRVHGGTSTQPIRNVRAVRVGEP